MCLICQRIKEIMDENNPYFVAELETGYVVLGDHQYFKGYTLFLCKDHVNELYELSMPRRLKFLEEMSIVSEAVARAFMADKMNYELLGNGDSHLHWHLFPRRERDLGAYGDDGKGPVWWLPYEEMMADRYRPTASQLEALKAVLRFELQDLLSKNK